MVPRRSVFAAVVALVVSGQATTILARQTRASSATPSTPSHEVTAIAQANVAYSATRLLIARSRKLNRIGWLEAQTTFHPRSGLTVVVLREGGDGGIRNRVLRKVLEGEVAMSTPAEVDRAAFSHANYRLTPGSMKNTLRLAPLRRETTLIDGTATVDGRGRLVRVEGQLARSPSFWVRSVTVRRTYQAIAGHALPVRVESAADVKMAGQCDFAMWIDYTDVDGRPVARPATRPDMPMNEPSPLLVALQQQRLR
jgi:hypothetical protein